MTKENTTATLSHLVDAARAKRLSRRQFMEGSMAAGLSATAASALWSSDVLAQTPQTGGTYRVGMHDGNTTDSLDPGTTESVYMIQLNHATRSYLTEITAENDIGPDVAESWEASADATEWRFKLAAGQSFHNGKDLTADDVVASLNYHRGEDSTSAAKALLSDVDTITTDGDTVVIKTQSGNADLPYLLSDYHLVILPSDGDGAVEWESGVGAGPYKLVNHDPGVGSSLEKHDGWHREGAYFDSVEILALADANARQSALTTGQVDSISETDLKTLGLLKRSGDLEVVEVASGAHSTIAMHVDVAPFDNPDVRTALKLAVNRQEIIDKILYNAGSIGNDTPIGPTLPYYADLPQRGYDPEAAKALLAKAGYPDGLEVTLHTSEAAFIGATDMAVLMKEAAAPAGINITVAREPADGYWSNVWLVKPFCVVQWGARPTPDVMFSLAYKSDAAWNETHWKNPRFNELLLAAKAELDQTKRAEMYAEMQQLCHDDGGTIVPFFRNRVNAFSNKLGHGASMAGNWELDGARSYQRWWFKA